MTTDHRALIADGRAHDEAMTPAPWEEGMAGAIAVVHFDGDDVRHVATAGSHSNREGIAWLRSNLSVLLDLAELGILSHERDHRPFAPGQRDLVVEVCHDLINRAMRNESDPIPSPQYSADARAKEAAIRALLDGYASALDEVERLKRVMVDETPGSRQDEAQRWLAEIATLRAVVEQNSAVEADNVRLREAFDQAIRSLSTDGTVRSAFCSWCNQRWPMLDGESHDVARKYANDHAQQCTAHPLRAELVTARTSIGEQALVIEQQDRDMDRVRADLAAARDMNRHYEQERDAWPAAYKQRTAQTDARIAELEAGPPGWICPTCKDPNCG